MRIWSIRILISRPTTTTSGRKTDACALVEVGMIVTVDQAFCSMLITTPSRRPPLLVPALGVAEVHRVDGTADHARSCGLVGTVRLVPVIRMSPSASYSHASASAERSSRRSRCMSMRAR